MFGMCCPCAWPSKRGVLYFPTSLPVWVWLKMGSSVPQVLAIWVGMINDHESVDGMACPVSRLTWTKICLQELIYDSDIHEEPANSTMVLLLFLWKWRLHKQFIKLTQQVTFICRHRMRFDQNWLRASAPSLISVWPYWHVTVSCKLMVSMGLLITYRDEENASMARTTLFFKEQLSA